MSEPKPVIRTEDLTKRYREVTAVDCMSMSVCRGEVFGLLGPNGAGKTTTISMLLGLVRPTSGGATVLGYDVQTRSSAALRRVGALVEAAFYPYLSARENLWVMAVFSTWMPASGLSQPGSPIRSFSRLIS